MSRFIYLFIYHLKLSDLQRENSIKFSATEVLNRTDGWMDGWMDGRMDGRTDGWMDGWTDDHKFFFGDVPIGVSDEERRK